MKKKYVTRNTVIKALLSEPLRPGNWFRGVRANYDYTTTKASKVECTVCAVGAVLRYYNSKTIQELNWRAEQLTCRGDNCYSHTSRADSEGISKSIKNKNYWTALSGFFESTFTVGAYNTARYYKKDGTIGMKGRRKLVKWVEKNFPSRVEI